MLADAKTFLKNKKISLDDPSFVEIRNMLGNKLKYCYLFTFMHYEKCVQLDDLKLLLNDFTVLKDHLHLIKDVTTYRDPKELSRDLNDLKKQVANKKFFDAMPKILKESIVELLIGETSGDKKYANRYFNSTYDFYKLKENYQKDFTKNVSRINTAKSLISSLDAYIKLVKQGRDIETIRSLYPTVYGCKLVHDENNVLILEVFERDAMKKLGTTQWCIARSDSHWSTYCWKYGRSKQYIMWNGNVEVSSPHYMIAFTLHERGKECDYLDATSMYFANMRYDAQDRRNDPIRLNDYFSTYGLQSLESKLDLKDPFENLFELLEHFKRNPSKKLHFVDNRLKGLNFNDIKVIKRLRDADFSSYDEKTLLKLLDSTNIPNLSLFHVLSDRLKNVDDFWKIFLWNVLRFNYDGYFSLDEVQLTSNERLDMARKLIKLFLNTRHSSKAVVQYFFTRAEFAFFKLFSDSHFEDFLKFVELNEVPAKNLKELYSTMSYHRMAVSHSNLMEWLKNVPQPIRKKRIAIDIA